MPTANNSLWKRFLLADWARKITALLVGLLLLQYVYWITEEGVIWLIETIRLVKWTLLVVFLTYLIPRLPYRYRSLLQLLLVVLGQMRLLGFHYISLDHHSFSAFSRSIGLNFVQLEPFIWFGLSAILVYQVTMWLVQAKSRIYMIIVFSVLFFAVRDSFTTITLWQQVAVVLFCGLSLLIVRHFSELKTRAPKSWETLSDYPASLGIPILLIVVVTLLIGAFVPSIDPILRDPYTAWKVSRGEPLSISGKGVPVALPSKDASSGYSRDDRSIGGGFQFDYAIVMTVNTDSRTYMRGETRSLYSGTGWEPSDAEKRLALSKVDTNNVPKDARFNTSQLETKEIKQTVLISNDETYPILFGGFSIQKLIEINKGEGSYDALRWSPRQSELRYTAKSNYPKEYEVISQQPVVDEAALRQTIANFAGKPEWNEYLQLPKELPARVKQLAGDITAKESNPYDKAKKIEQYLSQTFPYTNTPDLTKGSSKDFVDRFLFEIKEGYCDYYSTSMVVLARSIGLPARWVKGYSSGQSSVPPEMQYPNFSGSLPRIEPNGSGIYTIRNSDAHSWVEVYFDGWGWIPFEPTAGFTMPTAPADTPVATPAPLVDNQPAAEVQPTEVSDGFPWLRAAVVVSSVLAALFLIFYLLIRTGRLADWREGLRQKQTVNFNQKIIVEFEKLLRFGKRKGYLWDEHETMREAVVRWSQQSNWLKSDLEILLKEFEKAKYSQTPASEKAYIEVNQTIQKLRIQMK
jgi:transglutaminase-like putative cysteine protease